MIWVRQEGFLFRLKIRYLGYVQGMNDLLSPILIIMENEVDAFWSFIGLMERMESNFHMDQSHIKRQLANLHTLLQFVDAELANYLSEENYCWAVLIRLFSLNS